MILESGLQITISVYHPVIFSCFQAPLAPSQQNLLVHFTKSFQKYSLFIDLHLSHGKMLVFFLILDFFFWFFRKPSPFRVYNIMYVWSLYISVEKTNSKKKYFLIIFHSFNMKNYWKIFCFGIFFPTEIIHRSNIHYIDDSKGTCFPGKPKKKIQY